MDFGNMTKDKDLTVDGFQKALREAGKNFLNSSPHLPSKKEGEIRHAQYCVYAAIKVINEFLKEIQSDIENDKISINWEQDFFKCVGNFQKMTYHLTKVAVVEEMIKEDDQ